MHVAGNMRDSGAMNPIKQHATAPLVSAIITTFNRPERCAETVANVAQSFAELASEIVVVNNGKTHVNIPPLPSGAGCRQLLMPRNIGAAARNIGMAEARGRYLLMLDDDVFIGKELVEAMLRKFQNHPRAGAVFFRVLDAAGREEACLLPTVFHGCACAFRAESLNRAGGYPRDFMYYGEEYDVSFKLYRAGAPPVLCEEAPAARHIRDKAGRDINRIVRLLVRNNLYLWTRYFPAKAIPGAIRDTLHWYRLVAHKENATPGFVKGLAAAPLALMKGLKNREPLPAEVFEIVTLSGRVRAACENLASEGCGEAIVCGVGKFPGLWTRIMRRNNIMPIAFWENNTAWRNKNASGTPVLVSEPYRAPGGKCAWLAGTSSLAENSVWMQRLKDMGLSGRSKTIASPVCDNP